MKTKQQICLLSDTLNSTKHAICRELLSQGSLQHIGSFDKTDWTDTIC